MPADTDLATLVAKYVVMAPLLNERTRRLGRRRNRWRSASAGTRWSRPRGVVPVRDGRLELSQGVTATDRIRRPAGRHIEQTQPGVTALDLLTADTGRPDVATAVDLQEHGAPRGGAAQGWLVSATTVGSSCMLAIGLHEKAREGAAHDRIAQFGGGRRVHRARATGHLGGHGRRNW